MTYAWNDSLKIGIPIIDQQHKKLIDQMNALSEAMQNNKGKEELVTILNFLDRYVEEHFGYEESCMARYLCPVANQNLNAHSQFKINLMAIRKDIEANGASLSAVLKVNQELLSWFINHIRKIDIQLGACVK